MSQEAIISSAGSQIFDSLIRDQVAVYDQNYNQLFSGARPIKCEVREDSKLMEHPLEDGSTIVDHRIVDPVEIELSFIASGYFFQDIYQEIKQIFLSADLIIISTKSGTYENQVIQSIPRVESSDIFNGFSMSFRTKEAVFVMPEISIIPANSSDTSTVKKGNVQGEEAAQDVTDNSQSILQNTFGGLI